MKKIRKSVWMLLFVLMIFSMTACGRNNTNNTGQGSGTSQSSGVTNGGENAGGGTGTTGAGTTGAGGAAEGAGGTSGSTTGAAGSSSGAGSTGRTEESSTGVINGLIDDVERGVNDVTGTETTGSAR